ncbi:MAG TPA: M4 family metallopeptidase, partial [Marmoricola sp.]|nr:M4 family metallopeptidase [Marmoricola sp.]
MTCTFIPPWLLERLADSEEASRTLSIDAALRSARPGVTADQKLGATTSAAWEVHTADNGSTLPGALVRAAGEPPVGDDIVNEAASGIEASLALFADLGRSSYDGNGASVLATVHYEQGYDNAFWDGKQLVFGDGDGKVFGPFTTPIDVTGHEFTHAVTQYTANLTYSDQSGALNESVSDCFGSCVKQRVLGQTAAEADWLIGEGLFLPGIHGVALRSMKDPGAAYDDPRLGRDPQVGSMSAYVHTTDDNGG